MKYVLYIFFVLGFLFPSKQIYSTIQMLDEVRVVNPETLQIEQSIMTEYANMGNGLNCMEYTTEMECTMAGCEWQGAGMCDDGILPNSCMGYTTEMECNMSDGCEWMMEMCMENMDSSGINTPHFIAFDEKNGYWFVTTIASGYVAQYSLLDNSFIDKYFVGDAPALLVVDPIQEILYCSRMMPMNGMGDMMPTSESTIIQALNYSAMGLSENDGQEYEISSPAPHGLAINNAGNYVFTASNTADWIYKINTITGEITGVVMDALVNNTPDQTTQRLKPIQCLTMGNKLFVSCSAGPWMDPWTGEQIVIPGQIQMWDINSMTLLNSFEFGEYSSPWHIASSPIDNLLYIALSGDNLYDTEGVACLRFNDNELLLEWQTYNENFDTLHGITVSYDGQQVFVSGRGDGYIHELSSNGDYIDNVFLGSLSMLGGITIEQKGLPELGDANNDDIINVTDVVLSINTILFPMIASPYQEYASDLNLDAIVNVVDVILLVSNILED